jgi:hypothetical protein
VDNNNQSCEQLRQTTGAPGSSRFDDQGRPNGPTPCATNGNSPRANDAAPTQRPSSANATRTNSSQHKFTTTRAAPNKVYPAHVQAIVNRACQGDQSVLPELKKAFDEFPEWVDTFGDMYENALQPLMQLLAGANLLVKEAIVRKLDKLRTELIGNGASPPERMLIDRVCLDWLAMQIFDMHLSNSMIDKPSAHPNNKAASQLLDGASRRFNSGLKTLATIQSYCDRADPLSIC